MLVAIYGHLTKNCIRKIGKFFLRIVCVCAKEGSILCIKGNHLKTKGVCEGGGLLYIIPHIPRIYIKYEMYSWGYCKNIFRMYL